MRTEIDDIVNIIRKNSNFCIYTHIKPDGDAISSVYGLAFALQHLGKKVSVLYDDLCPEIYTGISNAFKADDVINEIGIAVDISAASRLGKYSNANITVCIDHHASNLCDIEHTYLDEQSISCSVLVFKLLEKCMIDVPVEIRKLLFIGIVTDSDCFQSVGVTGQTFSDATNIISNLFNPSDLIREFYSNKSFDILECEKILIRNTQFINGTKVAITWLPYSCVEKIGIGNTSQLSNKISHISGVELGITIFDCAHGKFNISFRSNGKFDANCIAKKFGGGGHFSSAGATVLNHSLEQIINSLNDIFK